LGPDRGRPAQDASNLMEIPRPVNPSASLLICTYEQPRELARVCAGVERQRFGDFDVWVCDDGSGPETAAVVADFRQRAKVSVHHVRHEHRGFRRASILNLGLRQATGRLIIFLDGDCVPHRDFVGDHVRAWRPGVYLAGRRVNLGPEYSAWLTADRIRAGALDRLGVRLCWSALAGGTRDLDHALRVGPASLRALGRPRAVRGLMGSNFSVARGDLQAVNGYDEAFEGYGHEDTELELRLTRLGLRSRYLKWEALQFHLWHPRRVTAPGNARRMEEARSWHRVRCERGIEPPGGRAADVSPGGPSALPSSGAEPGMES
jgi:glycosyltransferase involved in cell wall biosynthesis